jgi:SAM-dependent methyltransferase
MTTADEVASGAEAALEPAPKGSVLRAFDSLPAAIPFGVAIGLSSFLLFSVEPLVGRLVLPIFGGAAGVWATVLAFFQIVLLLGYLYAHASATRLPPRSGVVLHLALASAAVVATLAAPARLADVPIHGLPSLLALPILLVLTIGPAAFVLTSTTPLMSAWYARVRGGTDPSAPRSDPYWLYALSNATSLLALLAYPFVLEPTIGLTAQRSAWAVGFALLVLVLVATSLRFARAATGVPSLAPSGGVAHAPAAELPAARRAVRLERIRWVLIAAVPAGLLSAVTNFVTTDLISAPLLWVVPLALYLGSFVVAFSERGRGRLVPLAISLAPVAVTLMWVPLGSSAGWPILALLGIEYAGLAIIATAVHGRLAIDRPGPDRVTEFYVLMSAGGVLGGGFVAFFAPLAFDGVWEYPLLLVAALAVLALPAGRDDAAAASGGPRRPIVRLLTGAPTRLGPYVLVAAGVLALMAADRALGLEAAARWLLVGGLVLLVGGVRWFLVATTALVLVLATFILPQAAEFRDRSLFGVVEVRREAGTMVFFHGTTIHGSQSLDPARRGEPLLYFARSGPAGDVFSEYAAANPTGGDVRVVGLGAGSLAAYARPDDRMVFLEIDSVVGRVAGDSRYFSYLADAQGDVEVRIGDGRLLLEAEGDATLDLVVLDAFSSDAIPVHLITVEALQDAVRTLRPGGLLAIQVSNRYYDVAPAVAAAAERLGLTMRERQYEPTSEEAANGAGISHWVVLARSPEDLLGFEPRGWVPPRVGQRPFTDDFADLLHHMRPGAR